MDRLSRRDSLVLLAILGTGVFLAGLELMITAVALPAIVTDLADWTRLREASWIINGYLLVYVVTMPVAGRLADLYGARRLFLWALVIFTLGSLLAGAAPTLELLIVARLVQAVGGGALVPGRHVGRLPPVHRPSRPRALGVVGALTFLGMAAGPVLGAAILGALHPEAALSRLGLRARVGRAGLLAPAWRWVFYVNVPVGLVALVVAWAASSGWETPRRQGRVDLAGRVLFSAFLVGALGALTLLGSQAGADGGLDPATISLVLVVVAVVAGPLDDRPRPPRPRPVPGPAPVPVRVVLVGGAGLAAHGLRLRDRDRGRGGLRRPRALRRPRRAAARARRARGRDGGRGAPVGLRRPAPVAPARDARWPRREHRRAVPDGRLDARHDHRERRPLARPVRRRFGLTVTPRTTAAVEAVAVEAYGIASSTVTVARMVGMAVGLAILTAYGSTTIDRLYDQVYATADAYLQYIPEALRDRPLRDGLVVEALEQWAAGEAARIMVGIFLVAAVVTAAAIPPSLLLGRRRRMLGEAGCEPVPSGARAREPSTRPRCRA